MITIENITKSFEGNHVLNDISARFENGKTNLIIGQSGSGKTVLLKCILGLYKVDSGRIMFDDRDFTAMSNKTRKNLRKEIGMVFQGGALFDSLTVEENIRFPLDMFTNQSSAEKQKRVNYCLDRVNIKGAHKLHPSEISGGMQKRVAIARAIVLNPQYLFCDEPNSGLDPETATRIDKLVQEITKELQITTIINTHDMNSVIEIGEMVLFINEGKKCWVGSKEEILRTDNAELNKFIFANKLYAKFRENQ